MLNRTIYTGLSYLLAPIAVARLYCLRSKHPGYADNIGQRFGHVHFQSHTAKPLWLHAVSVGEVIASELFVKALLEKYPDLQICITTTTPTGSEQVSRSFTDHLSHRVFHTYAPYDLPGAVKRFLDELNPCGLIIMETELWPNWVNEMNERGLPTMLVNGRMSEKSERGYLKLGKLTPDMLSKIDCISAQTEQDAQRFKNLGAKNVQVTGNLKADYQLGASVRAQAEKLSALVDVSDKYKIMIAASTHPGEDEIIIDAFKQLFSQDSGFRLILVPRHPDRCANIGKLLDKASLGYQLRSAKTPISDQNPVLLADKLGELRALYGLGKIAVIGGTLVDHGGHNPLEPAAWGCAMVAGASQRNFDQIFSTLEGVGAMKRVEANADALADALQGLLENPKTIECQGDIAREHLDNNFGITERNVKLVQELGMLKIVDNEAA